MNTILHIWISYTICSSILLLALNFPYICYRNAATRYCTFLASVIAALAVISFSRDESPLITYFMGIISSYYVLRIYILIIIHTPYKEFSRLQFKPAKDGGKDKANPEEHNHQIYWETFPQTASLHRLLWTLDLVTNVRRIGWRYTGEPRPDIAGDGHDSYPVSLLENRLMVKRGFIRHGSLSSIWSVGTSYSAIHFSRFGARLWIPWQPPLRLLA
ncbi:hypothetical protein F5884DRAFT_790514 [Xylogone sp. PMI_703]|nr:hypothetical protein F5884DRAFT_790514 [Xylogone sp. PMI_703]